MGPQFCKRILASLCAFISCFSSPSLLASDIDISGFLTTGLAFTDSERTYLSGISKKTRVTEETFIGLNLSRQLDSQWRLAAQALAGGGNGEGGSGARVDWAFVSYEPNSVFELILGKQKIPMWMMSSYLDVGRAYPWVVPPEEVYRLFPLKSFTGASLGLRAKLGESTLSLEPYGGDVVLDSSNGSQRSITGTNMIGGSLSWTWEKLLVRAAFNRAVWDLNISPVLQFGERRYEILSLGLKFDWQGFLFLSEYASTNDVDEEEYFRKADEAEAQATAAAAAGNGPLAAQLGGNAQLWRSRIGGSKAHYFTVGQQMQDFLLHVTYASVIRPSSPAFSKDQKSWGLGLNYDLNAESVVKVEAKKIFIPDGSAGLFAAVPKDSEAMVYRLGYSLIF